MGQLGTSPGSCYSVATELNYSPGPTNTASPHTASQNLGFALGALALAFSLACLPLMGSLFYSFLTRGGALHLLVLLEDV